MKLESDRGFVSFSISTVGTALLRRNRGIRRKDPRGRTSISLDAHLHELLVDRLGGTEPARIFIEQATRRAIVDLGLNKEVPPPSKIGLSRFVMRLCIDKLLAHPLPSSK